MMLTDLAATAALACRLAGCLRAGDVVLLEGALGAGKTTFARALLRALVEDAALEVPSPTYTLVQTYEAPRLTVHHFDLWRLTSTAGLVELGWNDALRDVVLVEWPDRLGDCRPAEALTIAFDLAGESERWVTLGGWPAARLAALGG